MLAETRPRRDPDSTACPLRTKLEERYHSTDELGFVDRPIDLDGGQAKRFRFVTHAAGEQVVSLEKVSERQSGIARPREPDPPGGPPPEHRSTEIDGRKQPDQRSSMSIAMNSARRGHVSGVLRRACSAIASSVEK
jgi:hypothetical protein